LIDQEGHLLTLSQSLVGLQAHQQLLSQSGFTPETRGGEWTPEQNQVSTRQKKKTLDNKEGRVWKN